ncbi:MAG: hypothetical protein QW578_00950 [Thermoplasmatales archaeon]
MTCVLPAPIRIVVYLCSNIGFTYLQFSLLCKGYFSRYAGLYSPFSAVRLGRSASLLTSFIVYDAGVIDSLHTTEGTQR